MKKYFILCLSLILFPTFGLEKEALPLGRVLYSKGSVFINEIKVKEDATFGENARFKVGDNSLAILELPEGSKIKLSKNTNLLINSFETKNKPTSITVNSGEAFFKVLKSKVINKKEKFVVKNSFTSMGVRGTSFFISSGVSKKDDLWMCVQEGSVAVKSVSDKKEQIVKAGEGIVSTKGEKTSAPKPLEWTKKLNWNMDPKSGKVKNEVSIQEAYTDLLDQDYD